MKPFGNENIYAFYMLAFFLAFIVSLITVPFAKKLAFKINAVAIPNERSVHKKPMPLAGGLAIVIGFICAVLVTFSFVENFNGKQIMGLMIGAVLITVVGLLDDVYNLSARIKLVFQLLSALIVVYTGTTIDIVSWPWSAVGFISLGNLGKFVTVIWIIGVTNAINLIDGLDGLAAGVSSIAALCLMLISIVTDNPVAVILTAALAGGCLGFLPQNFNPATIFMGDTGSTFLGFSLAVISIQGLIKSYTAIAVFAALFVLGLPIFDTTFAIIRRLINKKPIMQADRGHLHHRLVDRGYSQKRAVLTLYGVSGGFGVAGILFAIDDTLLAILILLGMLIIWSVDSYMSSKHKNNHQEDNY